MRFVSTRGRSAPVDFATALFSGLAADGGLFVPERLDVLDTAALAGASLHEVGLAVAARFVGEALPPETLARVIASALDFAVPLVPLADTTFALELFHGPTFAFKDVGARTMARLMAALDASDRPLTVLVATSGDTGSAVADAYHHVEGTRVVILFPEGRVTPVQEAQFTTLGGNITAVAVSGTFDDCQRLAKAAFADRQIRDGLRLTSANSINIGRLLPQSFYYAHAALSASDGVFSVPSGNFGNLTAGLWARQLGFPIRRFVAATTINDTVPRYLQRGAYEPAASVATLANAMDVGDPSNFERMRWMFANDVDRMRQVVDAEICTDKDVRRAIGELFSTFDYVADPHTAIAWTALSRTAVEGDAARIFLSTAHPAKFREVVEPLIGREVPLPRPLAEAITRPRFVERIPVEFAALKTLLLD
jgi:threonine synthase